MRVASPPIRRSIQSSKAMLGGSSTSQICKHHRSWTSSMRIIHGGLHRSGDTGVSLDLCQVPKISRQAQLGDWALHVARDARACSARVEIISSACARSDGPRSTTSVNQAIQLGKLHLLRQPACLCGVVMPFGVRPRIYLDKSRGSEDNVGFFCCWPKAAGRSYLDMFGSNPRYHRRTSRKAHEWDKTPGPDPCP